MIKSATKTELSQISLTGVRAIVLLGLLVERPRSIQEIKDAFIEYNLMEESNSFDTIRIDINTLKHMGCVITRPSNSTNHKYILTKHPFSLNLVEDEIKVLKRVYNKIKLSYSLSMLIKYHEFFKKIALYTSDDYTKEALLGISILKHYDIEKLKQLENDCKFQHTLTLEYKNPTKNDIGIKEIVVQRLFVKSDKVYLQGFDVKKDASVVLNVSRILKILARAFKKETKAPKLTKIKFLLKDMNTITLEDCESIVESTENGYIVEAEYLNDFYARQRILSFGSICKVIEPIEFKQDIIQKLKEMRGLYGE